MSEVSAAQALSGQAEESAPDASEAGNTPEWYAGLPEDQLGFVQNKGWKGLDAVVQSYQNLEKAVGKDRYSIPAAEDADGWNDLYNKLGRPETPDNYKLPADSELGTWFKSEAHKAGLTQSQAETLFKAYDEMSGGINAESEAALEAQTKADLDALRKEHGLAYDSLITAGKKAAQRFSLDQETMEKMEGALGTKSFVELMGNIGKSLAEDSFEGNSSESSFTMTPGQAQAQINDLKGDDQFLKAYMDQSSPGHKGAIEKMQRLMKYAYPEG